MKVKKFIIHYHMMIFPAMAFLLVFNILPMLGNVMAFQHFVPAKGFFNSEWVGLDNFLFLFQIPDSKQIIINTVIIAVAKIIFDLSVPLFVALMLNEVRRNGYKRTIQTIVYIPFFLSWVILGGIIKTLFVSDGIVNEMLMAFGMTDSIMFLASNDWFRPLIILSHVWKGFGFGTIIYLAAIAGIDPATYEAAVMDGAGRWKQLIYITLPSMMTTIILLATLSLGDVLNAGFDQIFNLYNPLVYETVDIIDTYVYRMGLLNMQFSLASAVGLSKSLVSFVLIIISYSLASRFANYRIF